MRNANIETRFTVVEDKYKVSVTMGQPEYAERDKKLLHMIAIVYDDCFDNQTLIERYKQKYV